MTLLETRLGWAAAVLAIFWGIPTVADDSNAKAIAEDSGTVSERLQGRWIGGFLIPIVWEFHPDGKCASVVEAQYNDGKESRHEGTWALCDDRVLTLTFGQRKSTAQVLRLTDEQLEWRINGKRREYTRYKERRPDDPLR